MTENENQEAAEMATKKQVRDAYYHGVCDALMSRAQMLAFILLGFIFTGLVIYLTGMGVFYVFSSLFENMINTSNPGSMYYMLAGIVFLFPIWLISIPFFKAYIRAQVAECERLQEADDEQQG